MKSLFLLVTCRKCRVLVIIFSTLLSSAHADVTIEQLFNTLEFTQDEKQQLAKGDIVKRIPKEYSDQELAVSFAFNVKQKPENLYTFFVDSKSLDKNSTITAYTFIESPEDFKKITFTKKETQQLIKLINVKPGVANNLSNTEIASLQTDAKSKAEEPDSTFVVEQFQKLLTKRYQDYSQQGISGIAPYQRSKNKTYQLGQFFKKINQEISPKLKQLFPRFFQMSLNYPNDKADNLHEKFIFLKLSLQGRPAFALEHRLSIQEQANYLMFSRYFYVSHTLNGQQQLGMLFQNEQEAEAIAISIVRASSDEITGFGKASKQLIGRTMLWKELSGFYQNIQKSYE